MYFKRSEFFHITHSKRQKSVQIIISLGLNVPYYFCFRKTPGQSPAPHIFQIIQLFTYATVFMPYVNKSVIRHDVKYAI